MPFSKVMRKSTTRILSVTFALVSLNGGAIAQDDGSVFEFNEPGLEFSIQAPPLWTVERNYAGYAAVFKPSAKAPRIKLPRGIKADPSITIAVSRKPLEVNEESLEENAKDIEENFTKTNGRWTNFQIFQKTIVRDLNQGNSGLLYYVAYKSSGADVGQAVLIMGHEQGRFRVTLSDHRLNFDQNLETYYPYMASLSYKQPAPSSEADSRYSYVVWGVSVVVVSALLGFNARRKRERQRSRNKKSVRKLSRERAALSLPMDSVISTAPKSEQSAPQTSAFSDHGVSHQGSESGVLSEPAFSVSDLSSPPQSIPLSQVVDESSAPPSVRRRWSALLGGKSSNDEKNRDKVGDDEV